MTRGHQWLIGAGVALIMAGAASGYPFPGQYFSEEFFEGDVLDGRWSESFVDPDNLPGQVGNTVHAASWDPNTATLGSMWELEDISIASGAQMVYDSRDLTGTGTVFYQTDYDGGTLWLGDEGSWWHPMDGSGAYEVEIDRYNHKTAVDYFNGQIIGETTLVRFDGQFVNFSQASVDFLLAVAVPFGSTLEGETLPADFPEFDPEGEDEGHWGIIQKIRMQITPEPSMIVLLAAGGLLALRRRRR